MKTTINKPILVLLFISLLLAFSCKQQDAAMAETDAEVEANTSRLYDISANEEANIQLATNFVNASVSGDTAAARNLAHAEYWDYGPGGKDSLSLDDFLARWVTTAAGRTDQDPGIVAATSLVVNEGNLAGDWVNMWGTYTAKQGDYSFEVPWHRVFLINEGKIVMSRSWYDRLASGLEMGVYQAVESE